MSQLTIAVNVDLGAEMTEAELDSLTSALLFKLTKHSIETVGEELTATHPGLNGSVNVVRMNPVLESDGK
jgi:hypothetical protein